MTISYNISKLLTVSTAHLKPNTLKNIEELITSYSNEYGAFVFVAEPGGYDESYLDLKEIVDIAREQDVSWIKFDRDELLVPYLVDYSNLY